MGATEDLPWLSLTSCAPPNQNQTHAKASPAVLWSPHQLSTAIVDTASWRGLSRDPRHPVLPFMTLRLIISLSPEHPALLSKAILTPTPRSSLPRSPSPCAQAGPRGLWETRRGHFLYHPRHKVGKVKIEPCRKKENFSAQLRVKTQGKGQCVPEAGPGHCSLSPSETPAPAPRIQLLQTSCIPSAVPRLPAGAESVAYMESSTCVPCCLPGTVCL